MASEQLKHQLARLTSSMFDEGLLDEQFQRLQMLQDESNPGFVMEVVKLFCDDSERILTELDKLLAETNVDFQKVDAYVHQLKGSSSSVGAQNVKEACIQFRKVCDLNDKNVCLAALHELKNEYLLMRGKFETMLQAFGTEERELNALIHNQLKQKIQAYDAKFQK